MTQPNPDQTTIDNVKAALDAALPLLQAKPTQPSFVPLALDPLIASAQAILDYANGASLAPAAEPVQ